MVAEFDDDHPPIKHRVFEGDEYDAGEGISNVDEEKKVDDILTSGETFGSIKRSNSRF